MNGRTSGLALGAPTCMAEGRSQPGIVVQQTPPQR
jgi:hypothetical protein